jgi:lipopolysaccharide/colanic/teichoic acid biosynthesis glycosyltransferase
MIQRTIEWLLSLAGILFLLPVFAAIAFSVKVCDGGPVLYLSKRIGKSGRLFDIYKFRTMVTNADSVGGKVTVSGDPRVTPVGRLLRRYKLDELPQLLNVLKGDMSLVGPRPEDPRYIIYYTQEQRKLLRSRPGITSPASVHYRNEETLLRGRDWEQDYTQYILPHKLNMELQYLPRRTMWTDMAIVLKTLRGKRNETGV